MKRAPSKKSSSASHAKRKRAAAPRRTESDKFKHIVQHAIEGIFQSTLTGKLLTANPSFVAMLGYASIAELKHQPLTKIFYNPDDRNLLTNALASTGHVRNFELKLKRKDGSPIYVIENSRLIKDRKGKPQYIEGMIIDITSRKQIEEQLRAAEKKYQSIFNNAVEGIYQSTPDGTLFTANKAFLAMLGYESIEELERSDVTQLYVDPSARAAFREIVDREGVITDYELQLRRKDGRIITTLINSRAVRDEIGTTLYYEGIIQDITRRKMQEEQLRVLNAQKDKFLGIVSHDLRAPFNSILGFSELMLDDVNPPSAEEQKEFIRFINEAAKQQLLLLTNLLDWSRFETGRMRFSFKPVNLAEIVGKCIITLFGNAKKKQLSLVCDVPPSVTVYGDEYLLQQLFTNLISNALKFTPPGGSVRVQTHGVENHLLTVSVTDTGIGISPENIDKLFRIETKHTTRGTEGEEGSGLGLVLCAEIVEKHGGTIHAESVETKGTSIVFTLLLPRRTVVIAEDDKGDRLLIAQYIKQLYPDLSIIEAVDGEAAFSSIVQHLPCLVIADYVMPGMDGIRLIKELHKHPHTKGIPVVSMTSVQSQGSAAELRAAGAREVLMKPITKAELKVVMDKFVT